MFESVDGRTPARVRYYKLTMSLGEPKIPGGADSRRYIFLWVVGVESF